MRECDATGILGGGSNDRAPKLRQANRRESHESASSLRICPPTLAILTASTPAVRSTQEVQLKPCASC
jgi:hypothetical protein